MASLPSVALVSAHLPKALDFSHYQNSKNCKQTFFNGYKLKLYANNRKDLEKLDRENIKNERDVNLANITH